MAVIVRYLIPTRLWNLLEDKTILGVPGQTWLTDKAASEGWSFEVSDASDGQQNIGQSGDRIQFTQAEIDDLRAATAGGFFPHIDLANEFLQATGGVITEEPAPSEWTTVYADSFTEEVINPFWIPLAETASPVDPGLSISQSGGTFNVTGIAETGTEGQGIARLNEIMDKDIRLTADVSSLSSGAAEMACISAGQGGPDNGCILILSGSTLGLLVLKDGGLIVSTNFPAETNGQMRLLWNEASKTFEIYFDGELKYTTESIPLMENPPQGSEIYFILGGVGIQAGNIVNVHYDNFLYEIKT